MPDNLTASDFDAIDARFREHGTLGAEDAARLLDGYAALAEVYAAANKEIAGLQDTIAEMQRQEVVARSLAEEAFDAAHRRARMLRGSLEKIAWTRDAEDVFGAHEDCWSEANRALRRDDEFFDADAPAVAQEA